MSRRRTWAVVAAISTALSFAVVAASPEMASAKPATAKPAAAKPAIAAAGSYVAVTPTRLLDTRIGTGGTTGPVAAHDTVTLPVAGTNPVPASGVASVVVNLTVQAPTATGVITVYPSGQAQPTTSSVNFTPGYTVAHLVVVQLGSDGGIELYNGSPGSANLIVDVSGYYTAGTPTAQGAFQSLAPSRILDTRTGNGAYAAPVTANYPIDVPITGRGGVPTTGVGSVVLNVTVTQPTARGYLRLPNTPNTSSFTSVLNFSAGLSVSNLVVAPVSADGTISLTNVSAGTVQVIADVAGWFRVGAPAQSGLLGRLAAARLVDTRKGQGGDRVPARGSLSVTVTGVKGVPATGVSAVWLNLTAVTPQTFGYLSAYASGTTRPITSSVNFHTGVTVANLVLVPVGSDGKVTLYNGSDGYTQIVLDISGYVGAIPGPLTWSAGDRIDPARGNPTSVSCPTSTFCAMSDARGGVRTFNGSTWSDLAAQPAATVLRDISCVSASFCAAIDYSGHAFTYNGTSWSYAAGIATNATDQGLSAVSCASPTFCVATAEVNAVFTYDGTSWSAPHLLGTEFNLASVSCPTTTFCAVGGNRQMFTYHSGTWSKAVSLTGGPDDDIELQVSCVSSTFCAAVGPNEDQSTVTVYNGSTWSPLNAIATNGGVSAVDCVSTSFCVAGDEDGGILRYNGSTWSAPTASVLPGEVTRISCASTTFCVSVTKDALGSAATFNGSTWASPVAADPAAGVITSVSCATSSFCIAVDQGGNALTYSAGSWSGPRRFDNLGQPQSVSCPTTTFCVAIDSNGTTFALRNGSWQAGVDLFGTGQFAGIYNAVSCVSATFCAAVSGDKAFTYNGTAWTAGTNIDPEQPLLLSVSCVSSTFCMAVDRDLGATTFDGSSWSGFTDFNSLSLSQLSCASTTFCTAVDFEGIAFTYSGSSWRTSAARNSSLAFQGVSCASSTFCVDTDLTGNIEYWNGTSWSLPLGLESGVALDPVSCPTASFCVVADSDGAVLIGS